MTSNTYNPTHTVPSMPHSLIGPFVSSLVTLDQMIGCFCLCSTQKQTKPLPIEKVQALCVEN